jgi:hypothetical protein
VHTISDQAGKRFVSTDATCVTDVAASTGRDAAERIDAIGGKG